MKAYELAAYLQPFRALENRNALSPTYRALELTHDRIIGRSAFAHIERLFDKKKRHSLPLEESVFVGCSTLLGVANSLPPDDEVTFHATETTLEWECGDSAEGQLARAAITDATNLSHRASGNAWTPTKEFLTALDLGMISCGAQSQESFGIYGVMIDNRSKGKLIVCSSDDTTISIAKMPKPKGFETPFHTITLFPESVDLLLNVMEADTGSLEFGKTYAYYHDAATHCRVSRATKEIEKNLVEVYNQFSDDDYTSLVKPGLIKAFTQRAAAMAESKQHTYVSLGAHKYKGGDRLVISFMEGIAATEEYYVTDNLNLKADLPDIMVDTIRLARGLSHINEVVLDHLDRQAVVFRDTKKDFTYLISGRLNKGIDD